MSEPAIAAPTLTLEEMLPRVLPAGWRDLGPFAVVTPAGELRARRYRYQTRALDALLVLVSLDVHPSLDGIWLHSSVSRSTRLPSWEDLKRAHAVIHGDRLVVQVMPPRSSWLNLHPHCLHLFERLDADTVPPSLWRAR